MSEKQIINSSNEKLSDYKYALDEASIVAITNQKGIIQHVNNNFCKISKYTAAELIGQDHRIINSGYHSKDFIRNLWVTIANGKIWKGELKNKAKDGMTYWVDTTIVPFLDHQGKPYQYLAIRSDITLRKEAEAQQALLASIIASSEDAIISKNTDSIIISWNCGAEKIFGYSSDEVLGKHMSLLIPADRLREEAEIMGRILHGLSVDHFETERKSKDDNIIPVSISISPVKDSMGTVTGASTILRNITDKKLADLMRAEKESAKAELRFRDTLDKMLEGVHLIGFDWRYLFVNDSFARQAKSSREELLGYTVMEKIPGIEKTEIFKAYQRCFNERVPIHLENEFTFPDNSKGWFELRVQPVLEGIFILSVDITERKRIEQQLAESETRLRTILNTEPECVKILGAHCELIDMNPAGLAMIEADNLELVKGKSLLGLVNPHHQEAFANLTKNIFKGLSGKLEFEIMGLKGSHRWLDTHAVPLKNDEGKIISLLGITRDVTQRKALENTLREFHDRYELVSKATNDAIWDWDIEKDTEIWNHGLETIFGYPERNVGFATNWWKEKLHSMDYPRVDQEIKQCFARKETNWASHFQYLCADGSYKYVLDRAFIIYKDDKPVRMIGAMQDITEQKEFEAKITNIARDLSSLIENANVPIFGVDRNGYVNEWNKMTVVLTEYTKNDVLGKKWVDFLDSKVHDNVRQILAKAASGEPSSNYELPFRSKSGRRLMLLISISTRRDIDKNMVGAIFVGQDLTEVIQYRRGLEKLVKKRTLELEEALGTEKQLVEMKSNFISVASHEFRTPLSTISLAAGYIRKYKKKIEPGEIDKKLDNIQKQVDHMVYLLDDILLIGKEEAGKIKAYFGEFEIENLEKMALEVIAGRKAKHRLKFSIVKTPATITTDEKLMRNIITNLIGNAVKFSPGGEDIVMKISCDKKNLFMTFRDTGIGIPPEDMDDLFTSFSRGSNALDLEGTGLGLSIVKKVVKILNGTITVKSKVGKGTTFKVTLPLSHG